MTGENPQALTRGLRDRAREEGFDAIGIARAAALARDHATLENWLGSGRHAGMAWMAREPERRSDPRRLLPGCRSVVSLAINHGPDGSGGSEGGARVARYALGRDYHRVLERRLRALAQWLERTSGQASRTFVDHGPVLERAWAERSGIGWIGKNANLITRSQGSWLLLGEILTRAELECDPGPHVDFCGSCTACIEACPTDAIVADGVVDSNRCVSYWTIEHRGPIPESMRRGIGEWIFGCDVCQEVCPWNQTFAKPARGDPFARRADLAALDPAAILALDETTFRARYSGTSLMRAKWEGMRRNACVVLGNRRRPEALPALALALGDADPVIRAHAAWAIARIGGPRAIELLHLAEQTEREPGVREELERGLALEGTGGPPSPAGL